MVCRVRDAGHETGCHGLFHETLGDPIFPLPNNWPILPSEVEGRLRIATQIVRETSGVRPTSFRCPRLWGSTQVVNVLEKLGYLADASFPLYFYRKPFTPYHPSAKDWTKPGKMKLVEIPNFCDLSMESNDPYQRDRDQWPLYRTQGAAALMEKADSYIAYVQDHGKRPVVCFYLHPWEFHTMPQGSLDFGESSVKPLPFIVKNCGPKAVKQLDRVLHDAQAARAVGLSRQNNSLRNGRHESSATFKSFGQGEKTGPSGRQSRRRCYRCTRHRRPLVRRS